jgi:hypothetical protein
MYVVIAQCNTWIHFLGSFFFGFSFYRLGQFNLKTRTKLILNVRNFGYYETNGPTQTSKILELTT